MMRSMLCGIFVALISVSGGPSAMRPQLRWRDEIDNSSRPFVPKLHSKPNAIVPLQLCLNISSYLHVSALYAVADFIAD